MEEKKEERKEPKIQEMKYDESCKTEENDGEQVEGRSRKVEPGNTPSDHKPVSEVKSKPL